MKRRFLGRALCACLLACSSFAEIPPARMVHHEAPDWPQFRGPRRDGVSSEKGLLQTWPDGGPDLAWKISSLGHGFSSPVIVGDALFITGDTGNDLWIYSFDLAGKPPMEGQERKVMDRPAPGGPRRLHLR